MSLQTAHAAIEKIIHDFIAPRKCAIWGHEMGGFIALSYAGLKIHHPV